MNRKGFLKLLTLGLGAAAASPKLSRASNDTEQGVQVFEGFPLPHLVFGSDPSYLYSDTPRQYPVHKQFSFVGELEWGIVCKLDPNSEHRYHYAYNDPKYLDASFLEIGGPIHVDLPRDTITALSDVDLLEFCKTKLRSSMGTAFHAMQRSLDLAQYGLVCLFRDGNGLRHEKITKFKLVSYSDWKASFYARIGDDPDAIRHTISNLWRKQYPTNCGDHYDHIPKLAEQMVLRLRREIER